jgi:hypothetical protein
MNDNNAVQGARGVTGQPDEFSRRRAEHDAKPCEVCEMLDGWVSNGWDPDSYVPSKSWYTTSGRSKTWHWGEDPEMDGLAAKIAHARFFKRLPRKKHGEGSSR